jgi:hypothetical protein
MFEFIAEILIEGVLTLFSELFDLGLRKSLRTRPKANPLGDLLVGTALGFALGLASVCFIPLLALREPVLQWLNALLSPLLAALLILLWRRNRPRSAAPGAAPWSGRAIVFQAFMAGMAFNLSRLLFGH